MKKQLGFTMIELMIVLVVISILAAFAFPSYRDSVRKSNRAQAKTALMRLMQQQEQYFTQNNSYIVFSQSSTDAAEKKFNWFSGDTAGTSYYEIKGEACTGDTIQNCVMLTATPGSANVMSGYTDPVCGNLTLTSTGIKGYSSTSGSKELCW